MTGEARLLEALSDGRWHDHQSLYRLGLMVHSRVAVLRKRGHVIECRRVGNHYEYRLEDSLAEADTEHPGAATTWSGSASSSVLGAAVSAAIVGNDDGTAAPSTPVPGQLSIDEAA